MTDDRMTNDAVSVTEAAAFLREFTPLSVSSTWNAEDERQIALAMVGYVRHLSAIAPGGAASVELREAARELLEYADLMPKKTPAPGACVTEHDFKIKAGTIWGLSIRADRLRAAIAASSPVDAEKATTWRLIDENAPHACHVLAARFDNDAGEWIMEFVPSPPPEPWTHFMMPDIPSHIGNGGEGGADLRERLRTLMLQQPQSNDGDTYSDGFANGLCYAIEQIDKQASIAGKSGEDASPRMGLGQNSAPAYVLPCDVHLPPSTVIKAGCTFDTLKIAMEVEHRPRSFTEHPRKSLPETARFQPADARLRALESALGAAKAEIAWWADEHSCCAGHQDKVIEEIDSALALGAGER